MSTLLHQYVQNTLSLPVHLIQFPDRKDPDTGKALDLYLQGKLKEDPAYAHVLFSDNRWAKRSMIVDSLNSHTNIICDRYAFSGVAYSACKHFPITSRLPERKEYQVRPPRPPIQTPPSQPLQGDSILSALLEPDTGLPNPDLVIFFFLDPHKALQAFLAIFSSFLSFTAC
ncbi:putative Thymidylate kinase [Blattamonas nauphoetae]|uniref:dTMP kinase n=1 Tax=Blattamonas nauphoetae TaxID=2049346 RepID=A0ABQ9Y605_9EUKA|nr:putative Thymidylate kinase [Blattamonas nauphoetae]